MILSKRLIFGLSVLIAALLAGCASVPLQKSAADTARKQFSPPPPGSAGLYIYRNTQLGGALKKSVYIDGQLVGETAPMTYFYLQVPEGERKLSTESEFSNNDLRLKVEEGRNYFVRQQIKMGVFVGGASLVEVPEAIGRQGVASCRLATISNPDLASTIVAAPSTVDATDLIDPSSSQSGASVFEFYGQAEAEIDGKTYDRNLWAMALVEAYGDETRRKATYIELRARQLYQVKYGTAPDAGSSQPLANQATGSAVDFSGTYSSEISGRIKDKFNPRSPVVVLTQDGKNITGHIGNKGGRLWGEVDDNTIVFDWKSGGAYGRGKWIFEAGNNSVKGRWSTTHYGVGDWNLTRIE
jgi:hypothetical protein